MTPGLDPGGPQTPSGEPGGMGSAGDAGRGSQTQPGEEAESGPGCQCGCYRFAMLKIQVPHRWNTFLPFNSIRPFCVYLSVFAMVSPYAKIFGEKRDSDAL